MILGHVGQGHRS